MAIDLLLAIASSGVVGAGLSWLLAQRQTQQVQAVGATIVEVAEQVLPVLDAVLRYYPGLGIGRYKLLIEAIVHALGLSFKIKNQDDLAALIQYINAIFSPEISQNKTDFPGVVLGIAETAADMIKSGNFIGLLGRL